VNLDLVAGRPACSATAGSAALGRDLAGAHMVVMQLCGLQGLDGGDLSAPRGAGVPDGGERPSISSPPQRQGGSWRQSKPGVAGEDGSSLDKVASARYCRMGRAR
jgi:hypothetical protein